MFDRDVEGVLANISSQVIQDCNTALPQSLTSEHEKAVEAQVMLITSTDHKIRLLVCESLL